MKIKKDAETKLLMEMYERDNYMCQYCGKYVVGKQPQRAHVLSQGKYSRRMFGDAVIDSIHNWKTACSLECNNKLALNHATRPVEAQDFADKVRRLNERG